jgi:hypothetical protein
LTGSAGWDRLPHMEDLIRKSLHGYRGNNLITDALHSIGAAAEAWKDAAYKVGAAAEAVRMHVLRKDRGPT